ncbi:cyclic nucleotide-binding protein [Gloeomargarita lithophora Alchichica-D10]|uniref:Cyclic nucleotide-binding protein n=1 Tax=Gloeomargarita lithophora Alchichica-D10 TaxID=1188229 RepID=A0A1J0AFZ2_9CYAN|nr:ABC transporter ATP-binding protein [Gloeomargarita lithophora]APB34839.1 cyclic nucleotide-binding protein [Gloeomargarita lithophora Alchichica-D10]
MAKPHQGQLRKLLSYIQPYWRQQLVGIGALVVVNLLGVAIPLVLRQAINQLETNLQPGAILRYGLAIIALATLMWLIRMVSRLVLFGVGRQVEFDLKQKLFEHFLRLDQHFFNQHPPGELISRATSDVDNVRRLVGFSVLSFVNTFLAYGFTLPVMLGISVSLTLATLAVYPLLFFMVYAFGDTLRFQQAQVQERLAELSDLIQEDMSGMALIKIYAQEPVEQRGFAQLNQELLQDNLALARTRSFLFPLFGGIASVSLLILLWLGSQAMEAQTLTLGGFVALLLYVERLVFPTALLGFTITALQRGQVSIERVETLLQESPQIQNSEQAIPLPQVQGQLIVQHLSYTYPGQSQPALRDVSFSVQPGETLVVVGLVGAGKSTLIEALCRLLPIGGGQVFLDGQDITRIHLSDLRRAMAYVPQESFLFSTKLADNIRYGDPEADMGRVEGAAVQAQIHGEILTFPEQYETLVGERGITLSGGQRQRTALARGLLVQTPILLLDDALASVDSQTAQGIIQSITALRNTVILVTHQMGVAPMADRVLVLSQGRVVQMGTHRELVQQPGLYQELWQKYQFEQQFD